jgi:hypothetical protein
VYRLLVWLTLAYVPFAHTTTVADLGASAVDLRVAGKYTLAGPGPRFPRPPPPVDYPYQGEKPAPKKEPKK